MQLLDSTIPYKGEIQQFLRKSVYDQGKFDEYLQIPTAVKRMAANTSSKDIPFIRVAHKNLGMLLDLIGVTVKEMYESVNIQFELSKDDSELIELFKAIPADTRSKLLSMIRNGEFCKTWWMNEDEEHTYPAKKYRLVARRRLSADDRKTAKPECLTQDEVDIFYQQFRALPLELIPHLSGVLDVSARWLMCIDENYPIYTDDPSVDTLFDFYKLLNESARDIVLKIAKTKAGEG